MKKVVLLLVVALGFSFAQAQSEGFELGARFGSGRSQYIAIDGAYGLSDANRLHGDLSFGNNFLSLQGLYEWQFPIGNDLMVYPGVGAGVYSYDAPKQGYWKNGRYYDDYDRYTPIGILGVIGIEYQFPIPITVGFDIRTGFGLTNSYGFGLDGSLLVRYRF